jgi:predicted PurR-regulated permease PerM
VIIVLVGYLIYRFYFIGVWILVAAVLSFLAQPIAQFLDRIHLKGHRIPHPLSAFLSLLIILLVFFGIIAVFVPMIVNQAQTIAQIDVEKFSQNLEGPLQWLDEKLHAFGVIAPGETLQHYLINQAKTLVSQGKIGAVLGGFISVAGNIFLGLFAIFFISFFFVKDENMFEDDLLLIVPEKHHEATHAIIEDSKVLLKRYFIGVFVEVLSVMMLIAIGLWILGVKNALLIGFFAGIMNIIPYLGPILGAGIGIILGLTATLSGGNYNDLLPAFFKLLGVFTVVQLIDNNVLVPLIYAKSVKSHPMEIFLVIIMGGSLAGLVGMLLAVPVYTVLRVIAKEFLQQFRVVQKMTETMDQK